MEKELTSEIPKENKITLWQIFILLLCVYVLSALFIDTVFSLPPETSKLLWLIDSFICFIFIGDFIYNVVSAENKLEYLKWGWIDLVSSIPNFGILRWGRVVRIIRIFRILRAIRSIRLIVKFLFQHKAKSAFASVVMILFFLVIFSSIVILNVETSQESNMKNPSDALWWAFSTITAVGYGDKYPVTDLGRFVAAVLMLSGVGLFGTFTAYVAALFIEAEENDGESKVGVIADELKKIGGRLDDIERKLK